jgi:hypothetical protein
METNNPQKRQKGKKIIWTRKKVKEYREDLLREVVVLPTLLTAHLCTTQFTTWNSFDHRLRHPSKVSVLFVLSVSNDATNATPRILWTPRSPPLNEKFPSRTMSTFSSQRFRLVIHDFTSRRLFICLNKKKKEIIKNLEKLRRKERNVRLWVS